MDTLLKLNEIYAGLNANIYRYGSVCYGTSSSLSDEDFIVVSNNHPQVDLNNVEIHQYSPEQFQAALFNHEIWALECYFLPLEFKLETTSFSFILDKTLLRKECSAKSSNSWVKAKKKIDKEGEIYIGEKSLFHSLRILDFAIQLAETGKINFQSQNQNFQRIVSQKKSWSQLSQEFKPTHNELSSKLRVLCPF